MDIYEAFIEVRPLPGCTCIIIENLDDIAGAYVSCYIPAPSLLDALATLKGKAMRISSHVPGDISYARLPEGLACSRLQALRPS